MRKRELTDLGKQIKIRLIEENRTQEWLITRVRQQCDMYVDSSNLYKIMTGTLNSPVIEGHIRDVLGIP